MDVAASAFRLDPGTYYGAHAHSQAGDIRYYEWNGRMRMGRRDLIRRRLER